MLRNIAPPAKPGAVTKARNLRRQMSLPEVLLWQRLRTKPFGLKFRRQHASGPFILDFFCSDARLAIEIDGATHGTEERAERDRARDKYFALQGIATVRVLASEVLRDIDEASDAIVAAALGRLPLHHPAAPGGPPPRDKLGED